MRSFVKTRVLVTGGSGFVGSHLVRRLVKEGADIHLLVRPGSSLWRLEGIARRLSLHRGNIARYADVRACLRAARPEIIFNVAGMKERNREIRMLRPSVDVNVVGTLNLCKAACDEKLALRSFVQTGTCEEYGSGPVPNRELQREQPVSPYSAGKTAATHFCQMLHRSLEFPVVILRPCLLYGPGQDSDFFIPRLIQHCLKNESEFAMTSGSQSRDLGYVGDMVEAYLLAARSKKAIGEVINVGSGKEYKIKDVAKKIVKAAGSSIKLKLGSLPSRPCEIQRLFFSNEKARNILGWSPKVDLDEGLRITIDWYRRNVEW